MTRYASVILCTMVACAAPRKIPAMPSGPHVSDDAEYLRALKLKDYWGAQIIAEEKKLGREAIKEAVLLNMWKQIDAYRSVFGAWKEGDDGGLTGSEMTTFAQEAFNREIALNDCSMAAEISRVFELGKTYMGAAIACEVSMWGVRKGLLLACKNHAARETIASLEERFMNRFEVELLGDPTGSKMNILLDICAFSAEHYGRMHDKLLENGDYRLPIVVLHSAKRSGAPLHFQELWRRLFRAAATNGKMLAAAGILREPDFEKTDEDFRLFIDESLKRFECVSAFEVAYIHSLGWETMERIFGAPRCASSDFCLDGHKVTDVIQGMDDEIGRYFRLALRHRKFKFAWDLAARLPFDRSRYGPGGPSGMVIEEASKAGAYSVIIGFTPPRGILPRDFRQGILERALDDSEEWFVASYADGWSLEPKEPWVERAYLRALERGEYVMAAQIASRYGEADRLEARAILAYEMAMRVEKPEDARDIMRACGIETPERTDRIARMRYEQKRAAARRDRLEEKRRKRQECLGSKDWSPRCE